MLDFLLFVVNRLGRMGFSARTPIELTDLALAAIGMALKVANKQCHQSACPTEHSRGQTGIRETTSGFDGTPE